MAEYEKEKKRAGMIVSSSRPLYENDADLVSESLTLDLIEKKWRCEGVKLPIKHQLDYLLQRRNRGVAWVEIKVRKNPAAQYPTYMISLTKIMAARSLSEASRLPSFLVVQWSDSVAYIRMDSLLDFEISIGGRRDRNDDQDIEPVVLIPVRNFTNLGDKGQNGQFS
jgi:hypothetical protein